MDDPAKNSAPLKSAPPAPFPHRETHVAGRFGVSRDIIRELREKHLKEGVHWTFVQRRVQLSDEGQSILAQALRLPTPPSDDAPPFAAAPRQFQEGPALQKRALIGPPGNPGGSSAEVTLKAWHSPKNECILEAYLPGTDPRDRRNIVRVRVKTNVNFVRHMELPARLINPPDLYELARPCPRDRGSW
jgi:hypothetical protein